MKYETLIFGRFANLLDLGSITVLLLAVVVPLVILRKFWRNKKHDTQNFNKGVQGLEAIPTARPLYPTNFIGNIPLLLPFHETLNTLERLLKEHGDVFKFIALNQSFVMLLSGPLLQSLFKSSDYGHNTKEPIFYNPMRPFVTNGLLVSKENFWKGQRKILMRTQTFSSLKAYTAMLNKHSMSLVNELKMLFTDGAHHQISALISTTFLKIICGKKTQEIF